MRLVGGQKGCSVFTEEIERLTAEVKRSPDYRRQYMDWERQKTYLRNEGRQEKAVETAKNLLNLGLGTVEQIAQAVCLPLEEVQKLSAELAPQKCKKTPQSFHSRVSTRDCFGDDF